MGSVYNLALNFRRKHPGGIAWRLKKHCDIIEKHLNPDEKVLFVFAGQKNYNFYEILSTCVIALTNKRILLAQKRVVWGYFLSSVTPDMYNDLLIYQGLFWGKIKIDTIKEEITISYLPKSGLDDIETAISELMMSEKQKYAPHEQKKK